MYASWIAANFWFSAAAISSAERVFSKFGSSKSRSATNAMPTFGALTKPFTDRPGNATECATPGSSSMMSVMRRMTSSVRSSVAASGNCANATRYSLSCCGMKPSGTLLKPSHVTPTSAT